VDVGKDRVWTHGEVSIFHDDMPITLHFQESRQKLYVYHFISSDKTIADADWPRLFDTFDPETLPASKYLMGESTRKKRRFTWGWRGAYRRGSNAL
jgi:hypothetical protein